MFKIKFFFSSFIAACFSSFEYLVLLDQRHLFSFINEISFSHCENFQTTLLRLFLFYDFLFILYSSRFVCWQYASLQFLLAPKSKIMYSRKALSKKLLAMLLHKSTCRKFGVASFWSLIKNSQCVAVAENHCVWHVTRHNFLRNCNRSV
jgi:hypothetical protein